MLLTVALVGAVEKSACDEEQYLMWYNLCARLTEAGLESVCIHSQLLLRSPNGAYQPEL